MTTRLSETALNRATLARQLLAQRESLDVVEAVGRVVALQAQEPASPYLALWARVADFDPAALDAAFAEQRLLKATLMRITQHAVRRADYPLFKAAMAQTLDASRYGDPRFRRVGVTPENRPALVERVRAFVDRPRSNAEVEQWLDEQVGATPRPGLWWAMRQAGPFVHAPTGGPWSYGPRPTYLSAPSDTHDDRAEGLCHLVRCYLAGFGPASIADLSQFGMLTRAPLRQAVADLGDELVRLGGPDGQELYDLAGAPLPDPETPVPPRLLPMWDSVLLAYADRARVIPPEHRSHLIRRNGDCLPAILIDGYLAGVWRAVEHRGRIGIEVSAFRRLTAANWHGLTAEAASLVSLLEQRDRQPYRRYQRWWTDLPVQQTRVLA